MCAISETEESPIVRYYLVSVSGIYELLTLLVAGSWLPLLVAGGAVQEPPS